MLKMLIQPVFNLFSGLLSGWQADKAAGRANTQALQGHSWTVTLLTLVWVLPMVLNFIPALSDHVAAGFARMASLPDWYVGGFISITAAVFGIKEFKRPAVKRRGK